MLKIAIAKSIPYIEGLLDDKFIVKYLSDEDFINSNLKDCDAIIIRSTTQCNEELLRNTNIKFISTATAGFDHIDTKYCDDNGIIWKNSAGCNCISVAQYVLSTLSTLLLKQERRLKDIKLGIVGVGYTGGALLDMANIIGIKTMLCDPILKEKKSKDLDFSSIEEIYDQCDVISLHVPLTTEGLYPTFHIVNKDLLSICKKKPIIINACRGSVIKTEDITEAYHLGYISYIITDCWENEPNISQELLDISTISTPHIAGFSADGKRKATIMSCNNILSWVGTNTLEIDRIQLQKPKNNIIDLSKIDTDIQIETAIIHTTELLDVSRNLKEDRTKFKQIRKEYKRPREFSAYTVTNVSYNNINTLKSLGFNIKNT